MSCELLCYNYFILRIRSMNIRTRFAPSPTGYFHIAALQKVLYCYALAKKNNGQYIVRIEDTDRNRYVEGTEEVIFESHKLMGIDINESINDGGDYGPYRQSDRLDIYKKYAEELIDNGNAYYAFETKEELDEMRQAQMDAGHRPRYNGQYREYPLDEAKKRVKDGEPYVIRIKVPPNEEIVIDDLIMGEMKFSTNDLDDYILVKSDGFPTYHLAVVVDDHLMKISHIFRGVEWIATSPIMQLTYKYFGWDMPEIGHVPNILNPNGKGKLSKRNGSVALSEFFEEGYLKEAIINFIILLGWSPPIQREHGEKEREIFSLEEFIEMFDVSDLNKSNPKFNRDKLLWFNKEYIKSMELRELTINFRKWFEEYRKEQDLYDSISQDTELDQKISLVKERSILLSDILNSIEFFYSAPVEIDWDVKQMKKVNKEDGLRDKLLKEILEVHKNLDEKEKEWVHENWENAMREIGDKYDVKHGDVFMTLRLAIVGSTFSPPMFEALQILGKNEVVKRLQNAL